MQKLLALKTRCARLIMLVFAEIQGNQSLKCTYIFIFPVDKSAMQENRLSRARSHHQRCFYSVVDLFRSFICSLSCFYYLKCSVSIRLYLLFTWLFKYLLLLFQTESSSLQNFERTRTTDPLKRLSNVSL